MTGLGMTVVVGVVWRYTPTSRISGLKVIHVFTTVARPSLLFTGCLENAPRALVCVCVSREQKPMRKGLHDYTPL